MAGENVTLKVMLSEGPSVTGSVVEMPLYKISVTAKGVVAPVIAVT